VGMERGVCARSLCPEQVMPLLFSGAERGAGIREEQLAPLPVARG
jgi:hypothetical protein